MQRIDFLKRLQQEIANTLHLDFKFNLTNGLSLVQGTSFTNINVGRGNKLDICHCFQSDISIESLKKAGTWEKVLKTTQEISQDYDIATFVYYDENGTYIYFIPTFMPPLTEDDTDWNIERTLLCIEEFLATTVEVLDDKLFETLAKLLEGEL